MIASGRILFLAEVNPTMNRNLPAVSALGVAVMLSCGVVSSQAPSLTRTVYISVTDRNGVPVDTLDASLFSSRES